MADLMANHNTPPKREPWIVWLIRSMLEQRKCFHHDRLSGVSYITSELVDLGRRKLYRCSGCEKVWII